MQPVASSIHRLIFHPSPFGIKPLSLTRGASFVGGVARAVSVCRDLEKLNRGTGNLGFTLLLGGGQTSELNGKSTFELKNSPTEELSN